MSEDLIKAVEDLIHSSKVGGVQRLNYALNILKQEGMPLFSSVQSSSQIETSVKLSASGSKKRANVIQTMSEQEKILKIIDEFIDEFETRSLPHIISVKNYVLFLLIILKILRKLKTGYSRSLYCAHTLSRLNQMFTKYPVDYKRRTTRDPLALLFLVTELILEAGKGLEFPYELDETTSYQFVPLVTKYCMDFENPLQQIMIEMSAMPKFRLPVVIGENHKEIIARIFGHCLPKLPAKLRIEKTTKLVEKIILEQNDSVALLHYNTLKLFFEKDSEIRIHLSKIARQEKYQTGNRMFVKGIIEELARLGP
ncbi:MAG: hypothetical protein ACREAD_06980 [Nitrosopumilaceae archaeon]